MVVHILHQPAEAVPQEKADGEPGRVGSQAQNVERPVRVNAQIVTGQAVRQTFEGRPEVIVRQAGLRAEAGRHGKTLVGRVRPLRPADHRGVTDLLHVVPVRQQVVQSGGVGKGGVFSHRGVVVLLPAIGTEGRGVEGHQRRTAGLGIPDALDSRVGGCDLILPSGHQALHPHRVRFTALPVFLPCFPDGGVLLGIAAVHPEQQVSSGGHFFKLSGQGGMLRRVLRLPGVEKSQDCLGYGGIHPVQHCIVLLRRRGEAVTAPLRLALLVHAQQIGGVVPKEVGVDANGPLHRRRKGKHLGL